MLTKSKVALSALLVVAFASTALANGTNGYRVGDTWIEPTAQRSAAESTFASAAGRITPFTVEEQRAFDRTSASGLTW